MRATPFIEEVMRSLTPEQKSKIRSFSSAFVNLTISIFNIGAVIGITMCDSPREIPEDEWNGYDFALPTTDVIEFLDKHSL